MDTLWKELVASRLKAARITAKMSFNEAAEAAGLSRSTIQSVESGTQDTGIETVCRLCEVYGIPPAVIFAEPEAEK